MKAGLHHADKRQRIELTELKADKIARSILWSILSQNAKPTATAMTTTTRSIDSHDDDDSQMESRDCNVDDERQRIELTELTAWNALVKEWWQPKMAMDNGDCNAKWTADCNDDNKDPRSYEMPSLWQPADAYCHKMPNLQLLSQNAKPTAVTKCQAYSYSYSQTTTTTTNDRHCRPWYCRPWYDDRHCRPWYDERPYDEQWHKRDQTKPTTETKLTMEQPTSWKEQPTSWNNDNRCRMETAIQWWQQW